MRYRERIYREKDIIFREREIRQEENINRDGDKTQREI